MVEVWTSEALYSSWLNTSVILITASLLFYHMTRLKSPTLKVDPIFAAIIVSLIIVTDVCIGFAALIPYILRTKKLVQKPEEGINIHQEKTFRIFYITVGILLTLIELSICFYVIKDAISRFKK